MRVRIVFRLKNKGGILPFHHQALIRDLVERVLGPAYDLSRLDMFSYSGVKGQTKVGRNGLSYYSKRVTIVFSSMEEAVIESLCNALFKHRQVLLGSLVLLPELVEQELADVPKQREVKYLCISPLLLQREAAEVAQKAFVDPSSNEFSDLLYESTLNRMEASGLYMPDQLASFYQFQVVPDMGYLQKLAERRKKFARIYEVPMQSGSCEVRGYTFPFSLFAAEEVHHFIFQNGFGECTSYGFGMLDYSMPHHVARTPLYQLSSADSE